jgi:hypothetical protein
MVSEGVDIPRLGVVVWATAASTELMVRQVAGRALRGRAEFARLPASVHMPADPRLIAHARALDVLEGMHGARVDRHRASRGQAELDKRWKGGHRLKHIDPRPFVEWFDRLARAIGEEEVCRRCGWGHESGSRRVRRWRAEGAWADPLLLFDACHMAGTSFDALFDGDEYAEARAYVYDPLLVRERLDFRSVDARPLDGAPAIAPGRAMGTAVPEERSFELAPPEIPLSPREIRRAREQSEAARGEVLALLATYASLRRMVEPAYTVARAHIELAADVGGFGADADDEQVALATDWCQQRLRLFAQEHPAQVHELARQRQRQRLAEHGA